MSCYPLRISQRAQLALQRSLAIQKSVRPRFFSSQFRLCQRHDQDASTHNDTTAATRTTNFGFSTIEESKKESKVGQVFSSVASKYDTMNDLMSLGIHRRWKDHFVRSLDPGRDSGNDSGLHILDIAGGTGDIAFRLLEHARKVHGDTRTRVTVADINPDMLAEGRKRAASSSFSSSTTTTTAAAAAAAAAQPTQEPPRLSFNEANAEHLTTIKDNSIDLYTVAFGIRNFTHKAVALREAYRVLRPGGVFACLEFSKVKNRPLNALYKRWSFAAIPLIGQIVAADRDSYQYLVESIEQFPDQDEFSDMIRDAGFLVPGSGSGSEQLGGGGYENLSFGIAAIHKGVKPVDRRIN